MLRVLTGVRTRSYASRILESTQQRSSPQTLKPSSDDGLEVILKLVGESCNLNCHYCFERRKPYEEPTVFTPQLLERFLALCGTRPLSIGLHGGEPLLIGKERLTELFAVLRRYPGRLKVKLQTNATLLDDDWMELLDREWPKLDLGLSLDGPLGMNAHRVDHHGEDTTAQVEEAFRMLERRGRRIGVVNVITRIALGRHAELLDYVAGFRCIAGINMVPCLDFEVQSKAYNNRSGLSILELNPTGEGIPGWATSPSEYAEFLIGAYDYWREKELFLRFTVEPFTSFMRVVLGRSPDSCHFAETKCAFVLTVYPDGRIGSCDELSMPSSYLSDLDRVTDLHQLTQYQTNATLDQNLSGLLEKCSGCDYRDTCGGGCLATRLRYRDTPLDDEYCAYRMRVIDHVRASLP